VTTPSRTPATAASPGDAVELVADLTELEQALVRAARRGDPLDCGHVSMDELAVADDPGRVVRAELIRELLLGRRGGLDPRGIHLAGARITGFLDLSHVHAHAVLRVRHSVLDRPCNLTYARLPLLDLAGSHVTQMYADGLQVDGSVFLRSGFRATGSGGEFGAVRLVGAHLHGTLDMGGAELTNSTGPALHADSLQVDGNVFLRGRFRATSSSELGALHLLGATIRGQLSMVDATVTRTDPGPVVELRRVAVGDLLLPPTVVCPDGAATASACGHLDRQIGLDHLTYITQRRGTWRQWLHLLRHHSIGYTAQAYQQLAATERAQGHDGPARRILIAQQDDLRHRGRLGNRPTRLVHWTWGKLAGYGYRTGRLIAALLLAITTAGALGILAGHTPIRDNRNVAAHTARAEHPHTPCSITEQIGLGIDRGLPLGATGLRDRCDLDTTSHRGQAITIAIWAVQAMVWALATLAIAGYTGLIRKIN